MIPGNIMTEKNAKILQRINTYAEEKLADIEWEFKEWNINSF
jgi:hypothetical protein